MAYSSSNSDSNDTEDCRSKSNLSLSVGYFPCEDNFFYEDTTPYEDMPFESPSIHFLPPIQGMWRTESTLRPMGRRDQIQEDTEQFCKLRITLAWDVDVGSNNSDLTTNWDLNRHNQWVDKYLEKRTELTLSKLDGLVHKLENFLENQKNDGDSNSIFHDSIPEEDFQLSRSSPPDMAQINQTTGSQRTSTTENSSISPGQPEEDNASNIQTLSCLNFGWVFRWMRQQVFSSLLGREYPEKANKSPHRVESKNRLSHRSKRIQPQESLELGHTMSPDF
ncbi:uncharacterized protein C12orf71 homolog [Orycteropus afer afer]|uniref:Uncharacterized protein C12orf71 homolog n=1 Tax=Orycteropus afer afer TaxID=1230840 RepID=A0A8B7AKG6_ORYAF|nr:uncharacterized protein C12orf71 homolog [Orycteropus afer afer]